MRQRHLVLATLLTACSVGCSAEDGRPPDRSSAQGWPAYGGNAGGQRFSLLDEITPENVGTLEVAWEYRTGDLPDPGEQNNHSFEATPILHDEALYLCTPRSWVVALAAETGRLLWRFDPKVDRALGHYNLNCRGVAHWRDPKAAPGAQCRDRILVATADARLIALDAATGQRCAGFGDDGEVEFWRDVPMRHRSELGISSPPTIVQDVVVLGSAVSENRRTDMPSGMVHAFHARSGAALWTWDPIPKDPSDPAFATWEDGSALRTGAANVWSIPSADPERGLVFVPTSSPSPDFYGGERKGDNLYADSVVALDSLTGERVWHFQTVHHDLWDYDLASQPVLIDLPPGDPGGPARPAVAQATKMGHLFFLDRESGEPLIPVEERPVPSSTVPGERAAETQPFPTWPPSLAPQTIRPKQAFGFTPWDRAQCRARLAKLRNEGIFTPPSFEGSVLYPGVAGGSNWGSVAYDAERKLLIANTSNMALTLQILTREQAKAARAGQTYSSIAEMAGTPYAARTGVLVSPWTVPCVAPPWGKLTALDLETRTIAWEQPLGSTLDLSPVALPFGLELGTPNQGGPIVTRGGLVFIAAAMDDYLRAFDVETGERLWQARLPAGAQATPMTYRVRSGGRQYVVIAAGGHSQLRTTRGDSVIAFALPEPHTPHTSGGTAP